MLNFILICIVLLFPNLTAQNKTSDSIRYEKGLAEARELYYTNPKKAVQLAKKMAFEAESEKNSKYRIKALSNLTQGYLFLGEYENGLNTALLTKDLAEKEGDEKQLLIINYQLATMFLESESYESAIHYANLILNFYKEKATNDSDFDSRMKIGALGAYLEAGFNLNFSKEDLNVKLHQFENNISKLDSKNKANQTISLAVYYTNKARYFYQYDKKRSDSVIYFSNKIQNLAERENNTFFRGYASFTKASGLEMKGDNVGAIDEYKKAFSVLDSLDITVDCVKILDRLIILFKKTGDDVQAEKYSALYLSKKKVLEDKNKRFNDTMLQYERQNLANEKAHRNNVIFFIIMGGTLLFVLIFIKQNRKRKILTEDVRKELEDTKNKIQNLEGSLAMVESQRNDHALQELNLLIQNRDPLFLNKFDEMYPKFSKTLLAINSNVSMSELQYCALVRLNYSTKEIGDILGISSGSVDVKRHRLKKKLNLSSDISLSTWLATIE